MAIDHDRGRDLEVFVSVPRLGRGEDIERRKGFSQIGVHTGMFAGDRFAGIPRGRVQVKVPADAVLGGAVKHQVTLVQ